MVEKVHKFNSHCPNVCFGTRKEEKPMRVEEKKFSYLQNTFSFFLLFGPLLLSKLIIFSFFFILIDLKCYWSATLSSTNNLWPIITTKQQKRKFLGVQEMVVVCCFEFLTPLLWGPIIFSFLIRF